MNQDKSRTLALAAAAMQGILANPVRMAELHSVAIETGEGIAASVAVDALEMAQALLDMTEGCEACCEKDNEPFEVYCSAVGYRKGAVSGILVAHDC